MPVDVAKAWHRQQPAGVGLLPQANSQGLAQFCSAPRADLLASASWKPMMSCKVKTGASLAILVLILVMAPAAKADPIRIVTNTGGFELLGMGNNGHGTTNPNFDALFGASHSETNVVDSMGGTFITALNPLLFTAGFTGFGSGGTYGINFSQLLTVNGQTQTLNLLARLTVTAVQDTLRITASDPLVFQFDTFSLVATVLPVTMRAGENGEFRDYLCAQFVITPKYDTTIPEPATVVLLGTGLAGIATKLRRRRKVKTSPVD